VARFGRQLDALGIADELLLRGAEDGDLVMVNEYDFEFDPTKTNPYIPQDLLDQEARFAGEGMNEGDGEAERPWRPYNQGGFLDVDAGELVGFAESDDWDLLDDDDFTDGDAFEYADDEVWQS
jgi:hypothetical protein